VRCPVRLTDLWPSRTLAARALGDDVTVHAPPVDARSVPAELRGVRTMFDGLHHLRPADARAVLEDAHRAGASIVIGEAMPRRRLVLLSVPLIPLLVLLLTPRVRPVRPTTLVLTYLLPLLPLVIMWDGLVSCLRTYRPAELRALAAGLEDYAWEAGTHRRGLASIAYLVGRPPPRERAVTPARATSGSAPRPTTRRRRARTPASRGRAGSCRRAPSRRAGSGSTRSRCCRPARCW
jgi:hypothetical protein